MESLSPGQSARDPTDVVMLTRVRIAGNRYESIVDKSPHDIAVVMRAFREMAMASLGEWESDEIDMLTYDVNLRYVEERVVDKSEEEAKVFCRMLQILPADIIADQCRTDRDKYDMYARIAVFAAQKNAENRAHTHCFYDHEDVLLQRTATCSKGICPVKFTAMSMCRDVLDLLKSPDSPPAGYAVMPDEQSSRDKLKIEVARTMGIITPDLSGILLASIKAATGQPEQP